MERGETSTSSAVFTFYSDRGWLLQEEGWHILGFKKGCGWLFVPSAVDGFIFRVLPKEKKNK